ncbi:hypothetical protein Pla52o_24420 [Novipirellula galeiformis]|uniref:Uncharacterized protein n=1 Tax=Novipirellula galeiformis TaxID=2528004 RepID=A0A5C6CE82_9BACT|nr:hypothetical protein Pla52o_24420 [Novipirellula galeiformis]
MPASPDYHLRELLLDASATLFTHIYYSRSIRQFQRCIENLIKIELLQQLNDVPWNFASVMDTRKNSFSAATVGDFD